MADYKIGFLAGSLSGAGAQKTILTLSRALRQLSCRTEVFALAEKVDYPIDATDQIRFLSQTRFPQQQRELAGLISSSAAEAPFDLFVTSRAEFYDCIPVNRKYCSVHITPGARIRASSWFGFIRRFRKLQKLRKKFRNKKLIALSEGIRQDLINNLAVDADDVLVIGNPFDIGSIRRLAKVKEMIPEAPYIIHVGSMIPLKRHVDILHAFAQMREKSIRLVLVGKGPLADDLKRVAATLGIADRVVFWGWDPNPYRLIRNARLSILASETEGMPRVLIESLLIGTPAVSTDCPSGPSEVMTGELARFLVPVGDVTQLSRAMESALQHYPEIDQNLAVRFGAEHVARRYLELIDEAG
jgi:glycosyltransferase involved in cell wall biosynthesis